MRLINNSEDFLKYTSTPTYITHKIFYVGFTVLELSKWLMYDLHYNFIKKKFGAELLFTDTDSLIYEIKSENVYEDFISEICSILVIILKIRDSMMVLIKKLLTK